MKEQPLRVGFIGAGGINDQYRKSLRTLGQTVAAVVDVDAGRATKFAAEDGATVFPDYREMIARGKLDAAFIGIPPGAHTTQVADVANAGVAVFVAKPVALDRDTAKRTLDAIQQSGVINQVGYMARYSDITEKARELCANRPLAMGLGRFLCRMGKHPWWGKRNLSGGQMLEQSTHSFDLLRYFLGDVVEVHAYGHTGQASDYTDFEDSTVCNLRFASGAVGTITSTCCATAPDGFAVELSGRDFYLKLIMDTRLQGKADGNDINFEGKETGYHRQVECFCKAVSSRDQSLVRSSYADAVRTFAVTLAANRSLVSGRPEKVEDISR